MNVISMQPSQRLILLAIVSVSFIIVYIAFSRYVAKLSLLWLVLLLLSAKCAFFALMLLCWVAEWAQLDCWKMSWFADWT